MTDDLFTITPIQPVSKGEFTVPFVELDPIQGKVGAYQVKALVQIEVSCDLMNSQYFKVNIQLKARVNELEMEMPVVLYFRVPSLMELINEGE